MLEAIIFCDASVRQSRAGIAICIVSPEGHLIKQFSRRVFGVGKNNTAAEAKAILESIRIAKWLGYKNVRIYSDSKSLIQIANGARGCSFITRQFREAVEKLRQVIQISFKWVRGHAGKKWNCLCDRLAKQSPLASSIITLFGVVLDLVEVYKAKHKFA